MAMMHPELSEGIPRVSGGEPMEFVAASRREEYSPRERG